MLKAIIFDMDGVLIETVGINFQSFNLVLREYGVEIEKSNTSKYLGKSLKDQLEAWKNEFPQIPKELDLDSFSLKALDYQLKLLEDKLKPDSTIINLLELALSQDIKLAVATSSTKERAEIFLKKTGIFSYLHAFVTAEDVEKHKPHPDVFLKAAKEMDIRPENCLVIEDAVNGIEAANSAGMKSVAKLTKHHKREDFKDANFVFSDFKDLKLKDLDNLFN